MKNLIIFSFLFTVVGMSAQLEIRPAAGLIWASFEDVADLDFTTNTGYSLGADLLIGSRVYIQPGLHYEGKRLTIDDVSGTYDLNMNRFTIPVMLGYRFFPMDNDWLNVRIFTGPTASFLLSVDDDESPLNIDRDDFSNATFDWNAGLGLDLSIFFINAGYRFGLSDLFDEFDIGGTNVSAGSYNVFYANAGLRIRF
jgi:hypothetical protein